MLTGPELGAAIEAARIAKGVSKKKLADDFQVKPPSIQGWVKNGRIDKSKLMDVISYFEDVVGPEHWGLSPHFSFGRPASAPASSPADDEDHELEKIPTRIKSAAEIVRGMLSKQGKRLSEDARRRLLEVAEAEDGGGLLELDYYRPGAVGDEVWIAHYDVRAAMGGGQIPHDYPEMFQDVRVSPQHLREMGVDFKEHFHLKMVTGWGQSMAPTIKHRDPLLVDVSIREFAGDGIYMFSWEGHLYIKRLQWIGDDQIKMLSDNDRHPPQTIRADETFIQARVLLVWNAQLV
ncbi:XRE family transcriptional regulator [Pseudomonas sp. IT-P44]|uniref:S24 family peptidase n=1 Tax=Pseudomonas sp. IT-P44 TaxID=3026451 RepID=UPI0039E190D8